MSFCAALMGGCKEAPAEIPVVGVLPYIRVSIDDEDSLSGRLTSSQKGIINIVVIRLPRLSNFTDFSAFEQVEGVKVIYTDKPQEIDPEAQELAQQRNQARKNKDWALSDQLRDRLLQMGYNVLDTKEGTKLERK